MMFSNRLLFIVGIIGSTLLLFTCHMGRSSYMSQEQRQRLETAYDSLQQTYGTLMQRYESSADTGTAELKALYSRIQQMHGEMNMNHRQMMGMYEDRPMGGGQMMAEGMGMHMKHRMTGEWYSQMMSMHERMAAMHDRLGQGGMARMHRRLSDELDSMMRIIPGLDVAEGFGEGDGDEPSTLNGATLFSQNCASCHGSDAAGVAGVFPPLLDSKWVTGDKSVPIRILLNGLEGEIVVNGRSYQGLMPSFIARLNAAEMAAVLNYLRKESTAVLPEITREDVVRVRSEYGNRTRSWSPDELLEE